MFKQIIFNFLLAFFSCCREWKHHWLTSLWKWISEFYGCPVVRMWYFHCSGSRFYTWLGNLDSTAKQFNPKKIKKFKKKRERELQEENGTRKLICEKGVIGRIRVKVLGFQQFEITGHHGWLFKLKAKERTCMTWSLFNPL